MGSNLQLIHRNAVLETEVRFLKEQLTQAHNANQYLLSSMSSPKCTLIELNHKLDQHERQLRHMTKKNQQLKARLKLIQQYNQPKSWLPITRSTPFRKSFNFGSRHRHHSRSGSNELPPESSSVSSSTARSHQLDLLSFDENNEQAESTNTSLDVGQERLFNLPPGYSSSPFSAQEKVHSGPSLFQIWPNTSGGPGAKASTRHVSTGFNITRNDGKVVFIPTPSPEGETVFNRDFCSGPQGLRSKRPVPIADYEHNRLLGAACFVEAKTVEEQAEHWIEYARQNPRHSSEEWQSYYQNVIRPAYLQKSRVAPLIETESALHDGTTSAQGLSKPQNIQMETKPESSNSNSQIVTTAPKQSSVLSREASPAEDIQEYSSPSMVPSNYRFVECQPIDHFNDQRESGLKVNHRPPKPTGLRQRSNLRSDLRPQDNRQAHWPTSVEGLFFKPDPKDKSHRRTVLISKVPANISLAEVLSRVRGGQIVSSVLLATAGMKTTPYMDTNAVMFQFLCAEDAERYVNHCAENPVRFQSGNGDISLQANVELVPTATRPLLPYLLHDIGQHSLTRVLYVFDPCDQWTPETVTDKFTRYYGIKIPLNAGRDKDGVMLFEFSGMAEAKTAWEMVDRDLEAFGTVEKGFLPDPRDNRSELVETDKLLLTFVDG